MFTQSDTIARRRSPFGKRRSVTGTPMSDVADSRRSFVSSESRIVKFGLEAEELGVRAQEARADGVERPGRRAVQVGADERLDAPLHLARGAVREREEEERRRVGAVLDEARDAVDERARLARARARDDERRPVGREDDGLLLLVQLARVVDAVALRRRGAPEDVLRGARAGRRVTRRRLPLRRTACYASPHVTGGRRGATQLVRALGLWDCVLYVAGSMIGSGIFLSAGNVIRKAAFPSWIVVVWVLGAVHAAAAGLTYAELGARRPEAGGPYVYLSETFGPIWGFLYMWALVFVVMPGTVAALSTAFAEFLGAFFPALGTAGARVRRARASRSRRASSSRSRRRSRSRRGTSSGSRKAAG